MTWLYLILFGTFIITVLVIFAIVMWFINNREERQIKKTPHYRHDIIISGGVDIKTGQMRRNDHQYFNGTDSGRFDTVCIGRSADLRGGRREHSVQLVQQSTARQFYGYFETEIIIGRAASPDGAPSVVIDNDRFVSGSHCKIFEQGGMFCVCDMGSSNHTYLNGKIVEGAQYIDTGAFLKIGKETYQVFLN